MKRLIKNHLWPYLPWQIKFPIERMYLSRFVKNYIKNEVEIISRLCKKNKVSIDVGASWGVFTLFMIPVSSKVICFEPLPWVADELKQKFEKAGVLVIQKALGDTNIITDLLVPIVGQERVDTRSSLKVDYIDKEILGQTVTDTLKVEVEIVCLDEYNFENVGFIKIDVEGHELEVLKGAAEIIRKNRPNLFVEIEQRHLGNREMSEVFQWIIDMGYSGFYFHCGELVHLKNFNPDLLQKPANEGVGPYVNNFIFIPEN